jgi:hypothetical protein
MLKKKLPSYKLFRGVFPSWDNVARVGEKGTIFINSSPENFKYLLEGQIKNTLNNFKGDERLLFINAWNEWAEGCHLEPDEKYGKSYLDMCKKLINKPVADNPAENFYQKKINELESLINEAERKIDKLKDTVNKKDQEIKQKNQEIQQKDQEIKLIKSSKFWKLRKKYINLKNKLKI